MAEGPLFDARSASSSRRRFGFARLDGVAQKNDMVGAELGEALHPLDFRFGHDGHDAFARRIGQRTGRRHHLVGHMPQGLVFHLGVYPDISHVVSS